MTRPARGRGRPPLFTPDQQNAFLREVAAGATQEKAAAAVGISARTVRHHSRHHAEFADALAKAKAVGRDASTPHGASRYRYLGCRCDDCTADATRKRTARRHRQKNNRPDAEIHHLPTPDQAPRPLKAVV
ncbi:MAG: hypothetical protein JWO98_1229 [Frankiales bacterium]|nr:hypothetical protein [Frankiales bacterium]